MILPSFEIKNFRAFRHLEIESLGNVNLIVGKNNVGKTSLLEAVRIYSSRGAWEVIRDILKLRDEYRSPGPDAILSGLSSIFYGRSQNRDLAIANQKAEMGVDISSDQKISVSLTFVTETTDERGRTIRTPIEDADTTDTFNSSPALLVQSELRNTLRPLDRLDRLYRPIMSREADEKSIPCTFVSSAGSISEDASQWWDKITLTPLEDHVLSALRVINPDVSRISLVASDDSTPSRVFMVKTSNLDTPFPLKSLGEGMVRIIGIALAMVNAPKGIVLIDEIENGIHYSVQSDMWRLIFQVAATLNVQVFATSHSWDCIEAFQSVAAEHAGDGKLIRLENRAGNVAATLFGESELHIVSRDRIEVR